jgi:hypothetical protein
MSILDTFARVTAKLPSKRVCCADIGEGGALAVACIGGGYAVGTWFGKLFGFVSNKDRAFYADIFGVIGGLWGLLAFAIALGVKLTS